MPKDNLQLISARIDSDTLQKIETFTTRHCYWKSNAVINGILMTIFKDFNERQIYDMVRRNFFKEQYVKSEYEICDYTVSNKPKQ